MAFARTLERLRGEVTRAWGGFGTEGGDPSSPTARDDRQDGETVGIARNPRLPDFGVA
jgi:hypothetical protein